MNWKGIFIEFVRQLWARGIHSMDIFLRPLYDQWFEEWVNWKVETTMEDVDQQIEEIREPSGVDAPVFTETKEGSTALGGEMRLTAPWVLNEKEPSS